MPAGVGSASGARAGRVNGLGASRMGVVCGSGSGSRREGAHVVELQRSRLLAAAAGVVAELGWAHTTVTEVVARSRVSRRTFYEMFANREECLLALADDALAVIAGELEQVDLGRCGWCERVRLGLWRILAFLDREPLLAGVLVAGAMSGERVALKRREEVFARLAAVVDEGRREGSRAAGCTALTAEGLVGATFAIVSARVLKPNREPLTGLLGELMAMIVLPYLGPAAARREQSLPTPVAPAVCTGAPGSAPDVSEVAPAGSPAWAHGETFEHLPIRLTYRTARVLDGVGELVGAGERASNRRIAEYAGIQDPGQVSKLLWRLQRRGLLSNTGLGHAKGVPNAWRLTPEGERVARGIRAHTTATATGIGSAA